jgi:hypothetical protein
MSEEIRNPAGGELTTPGPYLAKVISHLDRTYSGYLQVEILQESGNTEARQGQLHSVRYLSPFSGQTSADYLAESNDYTSTQKAYGFWMVPPDPGAIVVVIFIDSDPKKGFWIGCVHDMNMNFSVPGHAATSFHVDGKKARVPVAEYNKLASSPIADTTKIKKPANKLQDKLLNQGTLEDDTRGITTSSARREIPSMVFGISTPGPTDKAGKQGPVGKHEYRIPNAFVSRLGGSEFVMDDGDDKWEREKTPSEGPPVYKSVEDGQTGLRDRPHNELMRFRTRTGHQILMHNSEDLIYIGNSRGTAWIELTSDGKMDIYCEDSINVRTKQDFNFHCDRDFNLEVGRNFNVKVHGEHHTQVIKDQVLIVDRDQKIHIKRRKDETIDEQYRQTVNDDVKKYYAKDYTHNVDGRMDLRVAKGVSFSGGNGASGPGFAPYDAAREDPEDPCANDGDTSSPVQDHNGPTPDRIDIKIYKDMRVEHIGVNVDHTIDGYLKTKVTGSVDINTNSTWKQTSEGDIDIKSGGHIFNTSAGSNETKAGGNIIETAPQVHMNGPAAGTAPTAAIAQLPEEARKSAKGTIPLPLKTHKLPEVDEHGAEGGTSDVSLIMRRMPTAEPYPHHENLDPLKVKPKETARDVDGRYKEESESMRPEPEYWKKYSTNTDTFAKVGK